MAKLRQNHTRNGKQPFAGLLVKVLVIFFILAVLFVGLYNMANGGDLSAGNNGGTDEAGYFDFSEDTASLSEPASEDVLIPTGNQSAVIRHKHYLLGYNERHEQADWATYRLTKKELQIPNVQRAKRFNEDPLVKSRSAHHRDYTNSGYSRGHMVPAGDMAFSEEAMQETFYMSNMSPQISGFNGGVWRELEESVRDWAYKNSELYVATGPIFDDKNRTIGRSSKVRVPSAFYKILVDSDGKEKKGIGFIIPHRIATDRLSEFAVSIDDVEQATGLDFFDQLYEDLGEEQQIEGAFQMKKWPLSDKRYQDRVKNWNRN